VELSDYLRILRKYWALILALALAGLAASALYSLTKTPEYSSSSKVFVSTQSSDNLSELTQGNTYSQQRVKTYVNLVSTPIVLHRRHDDHRDHRDERGPRLGRGTREHHGGEPDRRRLEDRDL
jgi:capsular polysaccharide biosynthesis protein